MSFVSVGNCELYRGNCLEVMPTIPDSSIDCILCDLPYGTTDARWDTVIPFDRLWEQYKRIIKERGAVVLFGSEPFSSALRMSNPKMFRYDWVWDKVIPGGFQIAKYMPMKRHETISVFSHKTPIWYPQMVAYDKPKRSRGPRYSSEVSPLAHCDNVLRTYTHKRPTSIIAFNKREKDRYHPTQKPLALVEYLIKTYTQEGDLILDNCMGSGSTGVAAKNTNRRFIGIEMDQTYYDISVNRIRGL